MDSIAEVMTPNQTVYLTFDSTDNKQVLEVERIVGDMADEGIVYGLEVFTRQ